MTATRTTPSPFGSTLLVHHAPRRTCVGCRTTRAKPELVRIAATPDGVRVDPDQVLPGRGAYVCRNPECLEKIERAKGHPLRRALRTPQQHEPAQGGITAVLADLHRWSSDTAAPHEGTNTGGRTAPAGPADTRTSTTKE